MPRLNNTVSIMSCSKEYHIVINIHIGALKFNDALIT